MSCSFEQTFVEESPLSFSLSQCQKKRNHPCSSLMQPHTIFNIKMQCNVLLPQVLLTRRQFQRLKYSVCPSVYTDHLIFTRKNWLIIATCSLYCRTNHLRQTNRLRRLVCLSINTANYGIVDHAIGRTSLEKLISENKSSLHTMRWRVLPWKNCDITVRDNFMCRITFDVILFVLHFVIIIAFKQHSFLQGALKITIEYRGISLEAGLRKVKKR